MIMICPICGGKLTWTFADSRPDKFGCVLCITCYNEVIPLVTPQEIR